MFRNVTVTDVITDVIFWLGILSFLVCIFIVVSFIIPLNLKLPTLSIRINLLMVFFITGFIFVELSIFIKRHKWRKKFYERCLRSNKKDPWQIKNNKR